MSESARRFEDVVEDFVERRRAGATIRARSFAAEYPELGPELLDALESAEALERAQAQRTTAPDPTLPRRVGAFRVTREIGRGGMGIVLEGVEEPLSRSVALKLLPPELLASASARARFEREAALAARLDHPGVCTVFGAGVTDGQPWIAMRLLEGLTLGRRIASARERGERWIALPGARPSSAPRAIATCIARVARALASAHAHGVLHRDVKPSNVMVTPSGDPVLLDFGLAMEHDADSPDLTRTGETAGTPAYLPPELIAGELARPDERCDVYSLGVTLYECLTLQPPFAAPTRDALYREVLAGAPPDVRRLNRDVPRDLAVVVATALARDRARRYASAEHFARDLEAFVEHRPIAARPVGSLERVLRWARREPRQALLAGGLAAAALALALTSGILLASRKDVHAGRAAERARDIDQAISDGFLDLVQARLDDAEANFARVLELDPDHAEAGAGRVLLRLRQRRDDEALALLTAAPRTPAYAGLQALAARLPPPAEDPEWLAQASAFELFIDGRRLLLEAERLSPSQAAEGRAVLRKALVRFDEAVARSPRARAHYHHQRAATAEAAGDERATRSACAALATLWPDDARSLGAAGSGLSTFDPRASLPLLTRSVELDPRYLPGFQCLAYSQARLGNFEAARDACERALEIDPRHVESLNMLGCMHHELGCDDDARAALLAALSVDPYAIRPWANLASFAPDAAFQARALEHVLELDPHQTPYRSSYGAALERLGNPVGARDQFAIVVAEAPDEPFWWICYARTLLALGETRTALDALAIARSLDPEAPSLGAVEERARLVLGQQR
ncbi:MAG: protein kinase [Planctomycetes bacterium]|nr:protein kinase [Planctomycetota bacterium]